MRYEYQREAAMVLYRRAYASTRCRPPSPVYELIGTSYGTPVKVEFDFEEIWWFKKSFPSWGEVFDPSKLHFIHVHPPGLKEYSDLDMNCLQGFNLAFHFPVLFSIVVFGNLDETKNEEHIVLTTPIPDKLIVTSFKSYRFLENEMRVEKVEKEEIAHMTEHLFWLRWMSTR